MADSDILPNARDRERRAPAAADAIAFTGGLGIAVGVFLLTGDFFAHGHGRPPGVALFAVLVAVGFLALGLLPHSTHAAAVTLIAAGIPGALAWWILPHAHRFADIRPFLILTILAWGACWLAPRTSSCGSGCSAKPRAPTRTPLRRSRRRPRTPCSA